jgi:hypothetical protein
MRLVVPETHSVIDPQRPTTDYREPQLTQRDNPQDMDRDVRGDHPDQTRQPSRMMTTITTPLPRRDSRQPLPQGDAMMTPTSPTFEHTRSCAKPTMVPSTVLSPAHSLRESNSWSAHRCRTSELPRMREAMVVRLAETVILPNRPVSLGKRRIAKP